MKDITFICSAIVSGTSMIAKVCMDHGGWFGSTEDSSEMRYEVYENARFRQLCRNALKIDNDLNGQNLHSLFVEFFSSLPDDRKIVLKYPKAYMLLNEFKKVLGTNFKVVYVIRNPFMRAVSIQKKDGGNTVPLSLADWNDAYVFITESLTDIDVYPILFERFFLEPKLEAKKLLEFVGLEYEQVDISGIDSKKKHF